MKTVYDVMEEIIHDAPTWDNFAYDVDDDGVINFSLVSDKGELKLITSIVEDENNLEEVPEILRSISTEIDREKPHFSEDIIEQIKAGCFDDIELAYENYKSLEKVSDMMTDYLCTKANEIEQSLSRDDAVR